jgi:hypothetical protein
MNTTELNTTGLPPDLAADARAIIDSLTSGKPLDPEVARRVRERGDRIRDEILRTHGVQDIGVGLIRELRGELPNP